MVAARQLVLDTRPSAGIVLEGISWQTYGRILRETAHHRVRMTFDSGVLEIMPPSFTHEEVQNLLSSMLKTIALAHGIRYSAGGATTFRKKDLEMGVEPDQCFWLQNAQRLPRKKPIDLKKDPSPDLVVEVDIFRSSLNRMKIYAAFGVPEVWRFDGTTLTVLALGRGKLYRRVSQSVAFPEFPMKKIQECLSRLEHDVEGAIILDFQDFVRKYAERLSQSKDS